MEDWLRDTVPLRLQERPEVLPPEFTLGVVRPHSRTTVSGLDTRLLAIFRSRLTACAQSLVLADRRPDILVFRTAPAGCPTIPHGSRAVNM
jgi:hypothetical protein